MRLASQQEKDDAMSICQNIASSFGNLAARWQDESEYEDINEYGKVLGTRLALAGASYVRMTKRPFGVVFSIHSLYFHMKVKNNRGVMVQVPN